jgi:hypothetical protein
VEREAYEICVDKYGVIVGPTVYKDVENGKNRVKEKL